MNAMGGFPLLELPIEVRLQIYRHVFGDRHIHLMNVRLQRDGVAFGNSEGPLVLQHAWITTVCVEPLGALVDEDVYTAWKQDSLGVSSQGSHLDFHECHARCESTSRSRYNQLLACVSGNGCSHGKAGLKQFMASCTCWHKTEQDISLSLLRSCRQVYAEAADVPYSTNSFSFNDQHALRRFVNNCSTKQSNSIRRVHIMHWEEDVSPRLGPSLIARNPSFLGRLNGLQVLFVETCSPEVQTEYLMSDPFQDFLKGRGYNANMSRPTGIDLTSDRNHGYFSVFANACLNFQHCKRLKEVRIYIIPRDSEHEYPRLWSSSSASMLHLRPWPRPYSENHRLLVEYSDALAANILTAAAASKNYISHDEQRKIIRYV